jgi:hypothetical protein
MQVAQRGTARTVSDGGAEGYQTLDRFSFNYGNSAGGIATISQDTTVPSGQGFSNSYKVDIAQADTSVGADHMIYIETKLEAQDIRNSGWDYTNSSSNITLSFWARSVKAGIYNVVFRAQDVGAKYYPVEYTLVADTWKKVTVTVPGDSSLVFNNDNGSGLQVRWNLQLGTNRDNGTANQWNATDASNAGTSNQVNFFDHLDNNFYLTGIQLEVGDTATDFEHRTFADELQRCQRYFCRTYPHGTSTGTATSNGAVCSSSQASTVYMSAGTFRFPVEMRSTPTCVVYSTANANTTGKVASDSTDGTGSASFISATSTFVHRNNDGTGVSANTFLKAHVTADAEL